MTARQGRDTFHTAICVRCKTWHQWSGTLADGGKRVKGEGWVCSACLWTERKRKMDAERARGGFASPGSGFLVDEGV
jgi:hypothetical protein